MSGLVGGAAQKSLRKRKLQHVCVPGTVIWLLLMRLDKSFHVGALGRSEWVGGRGWKREKKKSPNECQWLLGRNASGAEFCVCLCIYQAVKGAVAVKVENLRLTCTAKASVAVGFTGTVVNYTLLWQEGKSPSRNSCDVISFLVLTGSSSLLCLSLVFSEYSSLPCTTCIFLQFSVGSSFCSCSTWNFCSSCKF